MTDIEKYINYITKVKANGKRAITQLSSEEIMTDLRNSAYAILNQLATQLPVLKGRDLTGLIESMKHDFNISIDQLKNNHIIPDSDKVLKLGSIAILASCIDFLKEISDFSFENRTKTFSDCIEAVYKKKPIKELQICLTINNKKQKKVHEEVYEEESEYESSDDEENAFGDNDNDDDDSEEDEEQSEKEILLKDVKNREFIEQIFTRRDDDPETKILNYYSQLSNKERKQAFTQIKEIKDFQATDKPIIFKIMELPLPVNQKNHILKNYTNLTASRFPDNKLRNWFDALMTIPFGKYTGINLDSLDTSKVKTFLDNLETVMDGAVYGHKEAKQQIIQMMGQQIRNPKSKGNMLGIYGPPGNGKTSLVKEGIAKAMGKPMEIIALGGATDSSFLEGHSYTYEGSIYGRIVNALISAKCMDPILYFDELDKISQTHKGEEITNILIHLTDPAQNSHFRDKYFHGVDIDLSRVTMIFSFNDPSNINPILMDRITTVETKYLLASQKIHIATNYLLKDMMKEMGFRENDVTISNDTLSTLITSYTHEGGVRKLKSLLYNIVRELNLLNLRKQSIDNKKVKFPFKVETKHLKVLLKDKMEIEPDKIHTDDMMGVINGMWANSAGQGGVLPIEVLWIPSSNAMEVKATGNLQQVIKESTMVASTLAFNYLDKETQNSYLATWKDKPMGFHLHCPDGSTPKDGPSAGCALTIAMFSLLSNRKIKHDIAITGEINLQGKVTAIGGLENKLEGAKKAGITLALYPKENEKDIKKIKERNPNLIDEKFKVVSIGTFAEAMQYAYV